MGGDEDKVVPSSSMWGEEMVSPGGDDEKIFVSVRLRPLNEKEIARNDVSDWECIDDTTIVFKTSLPERSMLPTAYLFDRVFGSECSTKQVYEEGTKEMALSVVSGINSSIFAYGQTSSGKTYTMSGITKLAVSDIFEYVNKHNEREFVLKFSAMEIYNEAVRDLLSSDATSLRLLDDPERGTVVERLTEETLEDFNHFQELLAICEAQRRIGETALNETSSRSHQILRLTVESCGVEYIRAGNSSTLTAAVCFVDLAGSERASQTLSAGTRLKEGSHINRSLLTLGTVIRKLSKGRSSHVPYRDSKLTRILQNSLGGNARTAIVCTMNPARSHVEQSRNTLVFASCAKEVTTSAQVNVVMSDKELVKQLQRELAKLESQLMNLESISLSGDSTALLREKDGLIEQMERNIKELTQQRDLAQARLESLLKTNGDDRQITKEECSASDTSDVISPTRSETVLSQSNNVTKDLDDPRFADSPSQQMLQLTENPEDDFLLDDSTPSFTDLDPFYSWEEIAQSKNEEHEDILCKEVQCIEVEEPNIHGKPEPDIFLPETEIPESKEEEKKSSCEPEPCNTYDSLKQKIQELHKTINQLVHQSALHEHEPSLSKCLTVTRSKSSRSVLMKIPSVLLFENEDDTENVMPSASEEDLDEKPDNVKPKVPETNNEHDLIGTTITRKSSHNSLHSASTDASIKEMINVDADDITGMLHYVTGVVRNTIAASRFHSDTHVGNTLVPGSSPAIGPTPRRSTVDVASCMIDSTRRSTVDASSCMSDSTRRSSVDASVGMVHGLREHHTNWPLKFESSRRKIIELWARCNVPLVHRTYFFLLFKGDPSDNVYMEVELRRLYFMRDTSAVNGQIVSQTTSSATLERERRMLAKQIHKRFPRREREELYQSWGIRLASKQRSLQLTRLLWSDTRDLNHIKESAALVAKLVKLTEPHHAPKEMFGLSLTTSLMNRRTSSWRDMSSFL